jgi:hypothetical protein
MGCLASGDVILTLENRCFCTVKERNGDCWTLMTLLREQNEFQIVIM